MKLEEEVDIESLRLSDHSNEDDGEEFIKYKFCSFLKWRKMLHEPSFATIQPLQQQQLLNQLVNFRKMHELNVINENYIELCFNNFCLMWKLLSTLPTTHELYLPPLFNNLNISNLLKTFTASLLVKLKADEVIQSGNFLLSGVEGTGKTTIAIAMTLAVLICCSNYLLIYHDYKNSSITSIKHLTCEANVRMLNNNFLGKFGNMDIAEYLQPPYLSVGSYIKKIHKNYGSYVGFILDEVQVLYQDRNNTEQLNILREIEGYARTCRKAMIVLTGSSSDLVSVLLNRKRDIEGRLIVDFNRQLCIAFPIAALRDIHSLSQYLTTRYGMSPETLSHTYLCTMLYHTGGIGRWIHESVMNDNNPKHLSGPVIASRVNRFLQSYHNSETWLFIIFGLFLIEMEGTEQYIKLKAHWQHPHENPLDYPKCEKFDYQRICHALRLIGIDDPSSVIDFLVDTGVLYVEHDQLPPYTSTIQVALPQMMQHSMLFSAVSGEEIARLGGAYCTLYVHNLGINGGKAVESLVRPRLHKLNPHILTSSFAFYTAHETIHSLSFQGNDRLISNNLNDLLGYIFEWNEDLGLDGIQFTRNTTTNMIIIDGWQCKSGHVQSKLGGGSLATYRNSYCKHGNVSKFDDSMVASIIVNAEIGFLTLLQQLGKTFPTECFALGTLVITTTKIGLNALVMVKKINSNVLVCSTLQKKFVLNHNKLPENLSFQVEVLHTDKWFRDILEPTLLSFLPPRVVDDDEQQPPTNRCVVT